MGFLRVLAPSNSSNTLPHYLDRRDTAVRNPAAMPDRGKGKKKQPSAAARALKWEKKAAICHIVTAAALERFGQGNKLPTLREVEEFQCDAPNGVLAVIGFRDKQARHLHQMIRRAKAVFYKTSR